MQAQREVKEQCSDERAGPFAETRPILNQHCVEFPPLTKSNRRKTGDRRNVPRFFERTGIG